MPGLNKRPPFRSKKEAEAYEKTPKWRIWEAAMHLAAATGESYEEALESTEALDRLMEEVRLTTGSRP
jgi:hypothetical protein